MRKARRVAGAALTAGSAALGTTAGVLHLTATPAGAATVTVDTTADGDDGECVVDCTLREAIDTAVSGDTVDFSVAGTIDLLGAYGGQLVIDKNLTISGPGAASLSVDGDGNFRVFYIYDGASQLNVTISGITIEDGFAGPDRGGGILNRGENLTLTNTVVTDSAAAQGGGIAAFYAGTSPTVTVNGTSTISYNDANYYGAPYYRGGDGGGIYIDDGALTISGTTAITENEADFRGGGIFTDDSSLSISGAVTITDNATYLLDGGGIHVGDTAAPGVTITGATISGNTSGDDGGGNYFEDPDHAIAITNTTITGNDSGDDGGGIGLYVMDSGSLTITGSTITENYAADDGGGLYLYAASEDVTIRNTIISGNESDDDGGGIAVDTQDPGTTFLIDGATIAGNASGSNGGGLYFDSAYGDLQITGATISGNTADSDGGGIYLYEVSGILQIANTTISGNTADDNGGGIYLYDTDGDGERTIRNTTISGNTAGLTGGGVQLGAIEDNVSFFNSTISGNTAAEGGAVHLNSFGYYVGVDLVQTTVTDNHVTAGTTGGIYLAELGPLSQSAAGANDRAADDDGEERSREGKAPRPPKASGDEDEIGAAATAGPDQLALTGTIVSGNDGLDIGGSTTGTDAVVSDHSLIGNVVAGGDVTDLGGTIFSTNPGLGPLANNGGPTQTHALLGASLAIDAGPTPLVPFPGSGFDQRGAGFARVINGRVDIGAYERLLLFPDFTG
jgi:CSLREA domain-containing protein